MSRYDEIIECPACGSMRVDATHGVFSGRVCRCWDCGYKWKAKSSCIYGVSSYE